MMRQRKPQWMLVQPNMEELILSPVPSYQQQLIKLLIVSKYSGEVGQLDLDLSPNISGRVDFLVDLTVCKTEKKADSSSHNYELSK